MRDQRSRPIKRNGVWQQVGAALSERCLEAEAQCIDCLAAFTKERSYPKKSYLLLRIRVRVPGRLKLTACFAPVAAQMNSQLRRLYLNVVNKPIE